MSDCAISWATDTRSVRMASRTLASSAFPMYVTVSFLMLPLVAASNLIAELSQSTFLHEASVTASDVYANLRFGNCIEIETPNVTAAPSFWGVGTTCTWTYKVPDRNQSCATALSPSYGVQILGGDYIGLYQEVDDASLCMAACCDDPFCTAYSYTSMSLTNMWTCMQNQPCCYLKSLNSGSTVAGPQWTSGIIVRNASRAPEHPALGIRSAVPLGGLGAGNVELRADGTLQEWTIWNQSPAGSAKFGVVDDAWLAIRSAPVAGGPSSAASIVRTSPPSYAAGHGVVWITYSGSHPLSRLQLQDSAMQPIISTVYAYSTFMPGNMNASAFPAIAFTLVASNVDANNAYNVSFMLSLPLGAVPNYARPSTNLTASTTVPDHQHCMSACAAAPSCASWTFYPAQSQCDLAADTPWLMYSAGAYTGVAGAWSTTRDGAGLTLSMHPAGGLGSPAVGDVSMMPVTGDASATPTSVSFGADDDASSLWSSFSATGGFTSSTNNVTAGVGAAAVSAVVPAGGNVSLTIVLAWHFPNRDHFGDDVGNFYTNLWSNSSEVAASLANDTVLTGVVSAINAHHSVFGNANTSMPDWLADHIINQFSHSRSLIWASDGRIRQFESMCNPDIDSVHNDFQRHLPYLWTMSDFELGKMRAWGASQTSAGYFQETLAAYQVPFDTPSGRIMADVTSIWLLELYEIWLNAGDVAMLATFWPNASIAIDWMIAASQPLGLPINLPCTYDLLHFENYNTTTFNAFVYMAALKAAAQLAASMNDSKVVNASTTAFVVAQAATQSLLWNASVGYYEAFTGGRGVIQADCLYGQVLARHLGLGWLAPEEQIGQHLAAELAANGNPYGLTVVTGMPPKQQPGADASGLAVSSSSSSMGSLDPDTQYGTMWLGGAPDWSYLALALLNTSSSPVQRGNVTAALEVAGRTLINYRSRLNNLWDWAALSSTDDAWGSEMMQGMPYDQSHYGFIMVDYFLVPALSGQQTDIPGGRLSFAPVYPCPFNLPALLADTTGTISCDATGQYTLALAFGSLQLPAGGLSVNGKSCSDSVQLTAGQSISW